MEVPIPTAPGAFGIHDRTVIRIAVGPFTGDPLLSVEEGRRIVDALVGQFALRIGRLIIGRVIDERIEEDAAGPIRSFGSRTRQVIASGNPLGDANLRAAINNTRVENDRLLAASRWFGKAWAFRVFEDIFSSLWLSYLGLARSSEAPALQIDSERELISRFGDWIDDVLRLDDTRRLARRVYERRNALFHGTNPASIDGTHLEEADKIAVRAIRAELQRLGLRLTTRSVSDEGLDLTGGDSKFGWAILGVR
jgi:hypothetical protein